MKVLNWIDTSPIRPHSLSVREGRVLVTPQPKRPLTQYSGDGQEVCRVSLPSNMTPHHAVMTSHGTFVVCCNTTRRTASAPGDLHQVAHRLMHYVLILTRGWVAVSIVRGISLLLSHPLPSLPRSVPLSTHHIPFLSPQAAALDANAFLWNCDRMKRIW